MFETRLESSTMQKQEVLRHVTLYKFNYVSRDPGILTILLHLSYVRRLNISHACYALYKCQR